MCNVDDNADAFYEKFWEDFRYQQTYAFDSAVRDRFPAIRRVWGELLSPLRVLDFGCGNGVLSYWLWANGFGQTVVGVDVSRTGIENARHAFERDGLQFEHVDHLDALAGDGFDVVVSSHVLEHIKEPENVLGRIVDKAEWLVLEVPLEQCLWPDISSFLRGRERADNPLGHVNFWNKRTFNRLLHDAGLLIIRDYHYASAPYSPFNSGLKRILERMLLRLIGLEWYSRIMATHYIVLARRMDVPAKNG